MKHGENPFHPGAHAPSPHTNLCLTILKGRGGGIVRRQRTSVHAPSAVRASHRGLRETRGDRIDPHQADTGGRASAPCARLTAAAGAIAGHPRDPLPPEGQRAGTPPAMTPLASDGAVHYF
jgi:hypothetical protein